MMFEPIRTITSNTFVINQENIDTDQIIPARFLTTTERKGLGKLAFYDWRYDEKGERKAESPLNQHDKTAFTILVAGSNFGCGSSREHAPWALSDFGFKAVISSDIADIFKSNALKNGLLPVEVDRKTHRHLLDNPGKKIQIDLERQFVDVGEGWRTIFKIEPFAHNCLLQGVDPLGYILSQSELIQEYEKRVS